MASISATYSQLGLDGASDRTCFDEEEKSGSLEGSSPGGALKRKPRDMKALLITLGAAALVAACGSPPKYAYVKEGASSHTTQSANAKCEYQIKVQKTPPSEQAALKKLCMEGEGYRLKQVR